MHYKESFDLTAKMRYKTCTKTQVIVTISFCYKKYCLKTCQK